MRIFLLCDDHRIVAHPLPPDKPLRLDARGAITDGDEWVTAFVRIAAGATRERVALVTRPGTRIRVGSRRIAELAELSDGDHLLAGETEWIVSFDALPSAAGTGPDARCGTCCEAAPRLLACPRCRAARCEPCWRGAAGGVCATPGCRAPASLERPLWEPALEDFVCADEAGT